MLFSRKYKFSSNSRLTEVKNRLLGKHTTVHNFDFEIFLGTSRPIMTTILKEGLEAMATVLSLVSELEALGLFSSI